MSIRDYNLYGVCRKHRKCICSLCEYITFPERDPNYVPRRVAHKKILQADRKAKQLELHFNL